MNEIVKEKGEIDMCKSLDDLYADGMRRGRENQAIENARIFLSMVLISNLSENLLRY